MRRRVVDGKAEIRGREPERLGHEAGVDRQIVVCRVLGERIAVNGLVRRNQNVHRRDGLDRSVVMILFRDRIAVALRRTVRNGQVERGRDLVPVREPERHGRGVLRRQCDRCAACEDRKAKQRREKLFQFHVFLPFFSKMRPSRQRRAHLSRKKTSACPPRTPGNKPRFQKKESRSTEQYAADFFHPEKTSPPSDCPKVT